MPSVITKIKNSIFGKKRLSILAILIITILIGLLIWFVYRQVRTYEGFGTDKKLMLSYKYENKTNQSNLNVYAITDAIIAGSSTSSYDPQVVTYSEKPSYVSSNVIDMSSTDNLWLIIKPSVSTDHLPKQFGFSVRLDLSLNSGYFINFTVPKPGGVTPNKVNMGDNASIGMINLGNNTINVKGEGEIRDVNNTLYGNISKTMDNKEHPSYIIFDCSFTNVLIDTNSLILQFSKLKTHKRKNNSSGQTNQNK